MSHPTLSRRHFAGALRRRQSSRESSVSCRGHAHSVTWPMAHPGWLCLPFMPVTHAPETGTENPYQKTCTGFLQVCHANRYRFFSGTEIWYGVEQCSTRCRKPWPKWRVLIGQTIASCVVCFYKLCCLFYCFKMNWRDSSIEKLIQKFCFQFHLVRKTCTRKLVPVFW